MSKIKYKNQYNIIKPIKKLYILMIISLLIINGFNFSTLAEDTSKSQVTIDHIIYSDFLIDYKKFSLHP